MDRPRPAGTLTVHGEGLLHPLDLVELVSTALIAYNLSALNQVFDLREGAG